MNSVHFCHIANPMTTLDAVIILILHMYLRIRKVKHLLHTYTAGERKMWGSNLG